MRKRVRVVAYTYEASVNCPTCARRAWQADRFVASGQAGRPLRCVWAGPDEHGMPVFGLIDREGNLVSPVFDIDEFGLGEPCDTCHGLIGL